MAWTTPQTWADGNVLTAAELNEQVRDNLNFLFAKPTDDYVLDEAADYTTTSLTFVDIDATNLSLSITSGGGDLLVWFYGVVVPTNGNTGYVYLDVDLDGSRVGGDDGLTFCGVYDAGAYATAKFRTTTVVRLVTGVSAGSHTLKLQWKVAGAGTRSARLYAGAGTGITSGSADVHPQFGVREL